MPEMHNDNNNQNAAIPGTVGVFDNVAEVEYSPGKSIPLATGRTDAFKHQD